MGRVLDRHIHRRILARWSRVAQNVDRVPLSDLRQRRDEARQLRAHLDKMIQKADGRLVRPLIGSTRFSTPLGTDWSWRPDLWREPLSRAGMASVGRKAQLDSQVTSFHDCPLAEIALRQVRNRRDRDLAPFSLSVETLGFVGSFLSLSIELPPTAAQGLTRQHMLRLDCIVESERPLNVFTRLNIQHGPNTEEVLRELETDSPVGSVDFDLAHLTLNERRIEKLWLDVILDKPAMNKVVLRDLTLCRHHRADL
ncbi:hypothetical protein RA28_08705 [Ruegeria sp. ANG-S4]|uniref:DUF6478 family protein n=1 Tax=Ruegeria sp. ANG-S4 TaxID=1577904 RepID=UPI00057F6DA2|nr:DUF6478 family protein [Ruegeria sp. ANG-S4]KIC45761.1 hypothetical protein RA28_08705 [Ruegeria sp. ANG-S4]